jgi:hypothetical protein
LVGNYCGNVSIHAIANCLEQKKLHILYHYNFGNARDYSIIADAVKKGTRLTGLSLHCKLPMAQVEGLLSVILRCPTIEELDLSGN